MKGKVGGEGVRSRCPICGGGMFTLSWLKRNDKVLCRNCWGRYHAYSPPNSLTSAGGVFGLDQLPDPLLPLSKRWD